MTDPTGAHRVVDPVTRAGYALVFEDAFDGDTLDRARWLPHYLPQWSSREASAARYRLGDGTLRLVIEADQPPWCPEFDGQTRVSSLQTRGVRRPGRQPGRPVALRGRPGGSPGPGQRQAVRPPVPGIRDEFSVEDLAIDARDLHTYAAEWTPEHVAFLVDHRLVKLVSQSPAYPMQYMLGVYQFPDGGGGRPAGASLPQGVRGRLLPCLPVRRSLILPCRAVGRRVAGLPCAATAVALFRVERTGARMPAKATLVVGVLLAMLVPAAADASPRALRGSAGPPAGRGWSAPPCRCRWTGGIPVDRASAWR